MKKIFLILSLTILAFAGCSGDQTNDRNSVGSNSNSRTTSVNNATVSNNTMNMPNKDLMADAGDFMMKAAQGGMAEVELGKLAQTKSQNADVKKFAQMMIEDHSNANTELKALATKKSVTLPAEVNAEQKASAEKLKTLSGAEFDKAYVETMVSDHKKTLALFEKQVEAGNDVDASGFASKTLPKIKAHLETIQGIQAKMK